MKRPSATASVGFSESEISQMTGVSAKASTTTMPMLQSTYSRLPRSISAPWSPFLYPGSQHAHVEGGDQQDADEDQHRDGRAEAQIEPRDQLVEAEDRDRFGVLRTGGHDEDRVEDAEGVEGAEEQRDEDRRLHQRQRDPREALPGRGAVDLRRLVELTVNRHQPGQQQ